MLEVFSDSIMLNKGLAPDSQIADEVESALKISDAIASEMDALRDSDNETKLRLRAEAEHEVFANTPAKEVLWAASVRLNELDEATFMSRLIKDAARVELVEAYAEIAPEEGYALLHRIESSELWVEAAAKFGRIRGIYTLIEKAREAAKKPPFIAKAPPNQGEGFLMNAAMDDHNEIERRCLQEAAIRKKLLIVSVFSEDPESMRLLFERKFSELNRKYSMRSAWQVPDYTPQLASLGYLPAIETIKETLVFNAPYIKDEEKLEEIDKTIAGLLTIEYQIQEGILSSKSTPTDRRLGKEKAATLRKDWWQLVSSRRTGVLKLLHQPQPLTPRVFDSFERETHKVGSAHNTEVTNRKIEEYKGEIKRKGAEAVNKILRNLEESNQRHSTDEQYEHTKNRDLLCLYRAVKEEALRLHTNNVPGGQDLETA